MRPAVSLPISPEPDGAALGSAALNPFGARAVSPSATTTGQTLTAPVSVNANTGADAMTVTQRGGGRAISGAVTSASNGLSAVKGITVGNGSGVNGVNSGTTGQAGKFEITNAASTQPSLLVTTTGQGDGIDAVVTTTGHVDSPAVYGQHDATNFYGVGVEGHGGFRGVYGFSVSGFGVSGDSLSGHGVAGYSESGGAGVFGHSEGLDAGSYGVQGSSEHYAGVYGQSGVAIGILGQSDSGNAVVGISNTGYAGLFQGQVLAYGRMTAQSYATTSDRNAKQAFEAVDGATVLDKITALPITAWDYKDKPGIRHIGPMAQDFRAAFGLGADDTHIDLVDSVGVSLAAIKALQQQLQQKEARIAALELEASHKDVRVDALESQVQSLQRAVEARIAVLEQAAAESVTHP